MMFARKKKYLNPFALLIDWCHYFVFILIFFDLFSRNNVDGIHYRFNFRNYSFDLLLSQIFYSYKHTPIQNWHQFTEKGEIYLLNYFISRTENKSMQSDFKRFNPSYVVVLLIQWCHTLSNQSLKEGFSL